MTLPVVHEFSAGGVVWRPAEAGPEVCLIATHGGSRWQLPKGMIEKGESAATAAVREVSEETGLTARVIEPIETIEYWFVWEDEGSRTRRHKKVSFFLLAYESGETDCHDREVDEARWFPVDEAVRLCSFKNERGVLEKAREKIAGGSAPPRAPPEA